MQITAVLNGETYNVNLSGGPPKSIAEFRFQNTMNGVTHVTVHDVDERGDASVDFQGYGPHIANSIRFLDDRNEDVLHSFVFSPTLSNVPHKLVFVTSEDYGKSLSSVKPPIIIVPQVASTMTQKD